MAMASPCDGCGEVTSYICAAQYCHNKQQKILCYDCYNERQIRCWFDGTDLMVNKEAPENWVPAVLYWDEGLRVTGFDENVRVTYPSTQQPEKLS